MAAHRSSCACNSSILARLTTFLGFGCSGFGGLVSSCAHNISIMPEPSNFEARCGLRIDLPG